MQTFYLVLVNLSACRFHCCCSVKKIFLVTNNNFIENLLRLACLYHFDILGHNRMGIRTDEGNQMVPT